MKLRTWVFLAGLLVFPVVGALVGLLESPNAAVGVYFAVFVLYGFMGAVGLLITMCIED